MNDDWDVPDDGPSNSDEDSDEIRSSSSMADRCFGSTTACSSAITNPSH